MATNGDQGDVSLSCDEMVEYSGSLNEVIDHSLSLFPSVSDSLASGKPPEPGGGGWNGDRLKTDYFVPEVIGAALSHGVRLFRCRDTSSYIAR